ncbi:MAG: bifunctional hydroxymethylpyrimidine kinase/phosphomethylpyrimidine kinase [Rikenellaceae bacterium]|nr:bifunctional hydroxymethylpyrimidine kinase/phosphomethylpyrimidine kinase [Rikenellaceae bacterium]
MKQYKRFLTIAGSDSGGGAGIQADIKTAYALVCYAMSVITAVTAQNTMGVSGIHVIPQNIVELQLEAILKDIGVDAVKIGMVPTPETTDVIGGILSKYGVKKIILDPVMIATSGDRLISERAVEIIKSKLFPIADLVTPNIPETEFITGVKFTGNNIENFKEAAKWFGSNGVNYVLIKSGHIEGKEVTDYLCQREKIIFKFPYRKVRTKNTHGTGCSLSSAIGAYLALGQDLSTAVYNAEEYIHRAVFAGSEYEIGQGHGPIHHFFGLWD